MALCNCNSRWNCTSLTVIASVIIGVIAAFLQITAVITVAPVFLWVTFGIAVGYLAVTLIGAALARRENGGVGCYSTLTAQLVGILGTILFSVILLAIPFAATSFLGAIVVGLLLFFFTLTVTATACVVKCLANSRN